MASRITQEALEAALAQGVIASDVAVEVAIRPGVVFTEFALEVAILDFAPPYRGNRITEFAFEAAIAQGGTVSQVAMEVAILPAPVSSRRRGWMMLD